MISRGRVPGDRAGWIAHGVVCSEGDRLVRHLGSEVPRVKDGGFGAGLVLVEDTGDPARKNQACR